MYLYLHFVSRTMYHFTDSRYFCLVHHLKNEISNNSQLISEHSKMVALACRSLFAIRSQQIVSILSTHQSIELEEIQVLHTYGFIYKVTSMSSLVYLSLLQDSCENKVGNITFSHFFHTFFHIFWSCFMCFCINLLSVSFYV